MASFYRMDSESSHLPSMLSALEQQNFLFQLQLSDQAQDDSNEVCAENNDGAFFVIIIGILLFNINSINRLIVRSISKTVCVLAA